MWPACRVVLASIAKRRFVVFWATWGVNPGRAAPGSGRPVDRFTAAKPGLAVPRDGARDDPS